MNTRAREEIGGPAGGSMNRLMKALRVLALAGFAVLMVVFLPRLEFENSLDRWVPPGSPAIAHYKEFLDEFGGDGLLLVALHDPGGFTSDEAQAAGSSGLALLGTWAA